MRVVHMDSGLGNQMLDYAEYLAIRKANPEGEIYLDTVMYELPDDRPGMISKWNGYELERIFDIKVPMLRDKVGDKAWKQIVNEVEESHFWETGWDYAPVITQAINRQGYSLINMQKNSRENIMQETLAKERFPRKQIKEFFQTESGYYLKQLIKKVMEQRLIEAENTKYDVYQKYSENAFIGHSFAFKYKGFGIEKIDKEIRECFVFPQITDEKNSCAMQEIQDCNSIAIHARRSDMLFLNGYCYKYGYFKRAVHYIEKHVDNPVFFFFCDEKSRGWCEENQDIFGLDFGKNNIRFITWNFGTESYRDMQLMAECKHNIFTESTFGFWGAYLNQNPDKITCAPDPTILATNWF